MEKLKGKKPSIRFPEFKDDWQHTKLSELLSEAKKRNEDLKYGKDEVLSVSGELGIVNQIEHLGRSYAGASVHNYHVVETGDIVYTKSPLKANPFGIIKLNKGKAGIVSTLYAVYKVNDKTCYGPWLDYYFSLDANTNRYLRPLVKKGAKNDMKINNAYVLHDRIFAPSIPEQKRIASFFTVVDKKIAELKQKKALLEQYKKGIMQKIFSQELRFKPARPSGGDDNGKKFPKWEKKKLGEIAEIKTGNKDTQNRIDDGIYPFYVRSDTVERINSYSYDGEAILTSGDGVGVGKNFHYVNGKFDFHQRVYSIRNFTKETCGKYIFYFFSTFFYDRVKRMSAKNSVDSVRMEMISEMKMDYPVLKEQIKIANFLSAIDDKINQTETQIQQMQEWKTGLLQKMFV
jgi:type I restriction enzyme S subunit